MKLFNLRLVTVCIALSSCLYVSSCKGKQKDTPATADTLTVAPAPVTPTPAPVQISPDDTLTNGVKDATKDFPGVNATVNNGEITLTGQIERNRLPSLMRSLNTLRPKKINNELTVK